MNFEEFKQQLMEDLKEALSRRVGTEVAVEENEVHKLQQESYDGIVVRKENESIGVNVDATRLYSDLEQGRAYEDVLHYAVDIAQKGFEDAPSICTWKHIYEGGLLCIRTNHVDSCWMCIIRIFNANLVQCRYCTRM